MLYKEQLQKDEISCPTCSKKVKPEDYFLDLDLAFYLNEIKNNYPQVLEITEEDCDEFYGNLVIANKYWCILTKQKQLINLQPKCILPPDKDIGIIDYEINQINQQITDYLRQLSLRLNNYQIGNNVKIQNTEFVNRFNDIINQSITFQQVQNNSDLYEDQYTFTAFFTDYGINRQTFIFIFVPRLNQWFGTSLTTMKDTNFIHNDYCTMAKIYKKFQNMHSILIYGGVKQNDNDKFSKELFEANIFSQHPSEMKNKQLQIKELQSGLSEKVMASCLSYNNKLIVLGGYIKIDNTKQETITNTVECFNCESNSWQQLQNMPTQRGLFNFAKFNNMVYVFGGYEVVKNIKIQSRNIDIFDLNTFVWKCSANVLPQFQSLDVTRYFQARGLGFYKNVKKLIVFGGRRLELIEGEVKDDEREQHLTEFCLDTNILTITDIKLLNTEKQVDTLGIADFSVFDYQPVYYNGRVYFSHYVDIKNYKTSRLLIYDEYNDNKLCSNIKR